MQRKQSFCWVHFLKLEKQNEGVDTFLSRFTNDFNVLHGNFKKLLCDEGRHIHLRERDNDVKTTNGSPVRRF